ncbi:MAG: putative membrane protein [Planctomycetota bacterium]|jgi:uncharacterized membrane protein
MGQTIITQIIQAPVAVVWAAVSNIEGFPGVTSDIIKVEYLSETRCGVGTRFRETRLMGKRETTCELAVTEFVPEERVRFVSDKGGTIWDTVYTLTPSKNDSTEVNLAMDARAYRLLAKVFNLLIAGLVRREVEKDLGRVKTYCEAQVQARHIGHSDL